MGKLINDQVFLNDNIFQFEKRLESQYTIFLDKTPTFVTYYHINNLNSIVDSGFYNVEEVLGSKSPVRFQKIEDFPIYGIENIKLELQDEEEGLTTSYDGEGIILPNTIRPLPNDFFTITYLNSDYLFMINSIEYDTIKSNNFYHISYQLRSTNPDNREDVDAQVMERYKCIFQNIGTDDRCLIKEDELLQYTELNYVYSSMVDKYKTLFYSERFNSLLYNEENNDFLYDKYLTHFINSNYLLNNKRNYETLTLSNEDYNNRFVIEYDVCFYSAIERQDIRDVNYIRTLSSTILNPSSVFKYYNADKVKSIMFIDTGINTYLPDILIDNIRNNIVTDETPILEKILIKYFNNGIDSIYNLFIEELKTYRITYNYYDFNMIPITLFILRFYADKFMTI